MMYLLVILAWFTCGVLSIFLGGVADRISKTDVFDEDFLFTLSIGPIGTLITIGFLLLFLMSVDIRILTKVYKLGRGEDN